MFDPQHVADATSDKIAQIVKGLRLLVKGWHGWQNDRSGFGRRRHIAQLNQIERGLAHHQHQRPLLLEADIGGPLN